MMEENGKFLTYRCVMLLGVVLLCSWGFGAGQDTSPLDEVHDGLQLSDNEQQMLSNVSDGTPNSEEIGFYMMMGKVASLPKLEGDSIEGLEAPGYKNLMRNPARFRYQPLRMPIRIYTEIGRAHV